MIRLLFNRFDGGRLLSSETFPLRAWNSDRRAVMKLICSIKEIICKPFVQFIFTCAFRYSAREGLVAGGGGSIDSPALATRLTNKYNVLMN